MGKHLYTQGGEMMDRLILHIPSVDELWFRRQMMSDPATMSYNAHYELGFPGYHPDTGCIDFPQDAWKPWYDRFIGREPERFYAYLARAADRTFVGEIVLRREQPDIPRYEMGIVIASAFRGLGYGHSGMRLLLSAAFDRLHAQSVTNCFETTRTAAVKLHRAAGFYAQREENGLTHWLLTKDEYEKRLRS